MIPFDHSCLYLGYLAHLGTFFPSGGPVSATVTIHSKFSLFWGHINLVKVSSEKQTPSLGSVGIMVALVYHVHVWHAADNDWNNISVAAHPMMMVPAAPFRTRYSVSL